MSVHLSHRCARALAAVLASAFFIAAPMGAGSFAPAQAQVQVSAEFRTALAPFGRWERHSRWGEVWIPANRSRDWRPYTVGRWVYSNDWGWYWAEAQEEANWGWVTYHYGRWCFDREFGWVWIPGEEWGPAFVQWRHGREYVGWAPLPPDEIIVEYRDEPEVWIFVRVRDFAIAPRLVGVILPVREYPLYLSQTIVVNQTVLLRDRGHFAVDPGIPPTIIAAAIGQPLRAYDVRPRILAGTAQIPGAIEVRAQDLRNRNLASQVTVRETPNMIRPTARTPQLQPLAAGEQGRLGDNPPRAASGFQQQQGQRAQQPQQPKAAQPSTQGAAQPQSGPQQQPGQQQRAQQPAQQPQPPKGAQPPSQGATQQQGQQAQQPGRRVQEPAQTQGRGTEAPRQQLERERQGVAPKQRPGTEGRGDVGPSRQQPQAGRQAIEPQRPAPPPPRGAQSKPGGAAAPQAPQAPKPPSATEGRGGPSGGPPHAAPQQGGRPGGTEGRANQPARP